MNRKLALMLLLAGIAGCSTTPAPKYFTLDMTPSGSAQAPRVAAVARLHEAESLARHELLIQRSPTEVEYYALDQWAAALGELVSQKLEAEFAAGGAGREHADLAVSGEIVNFGQVDTAGGAEALARISVEVRFEEQSRYDEALLRKTYEARIPCDEKSPGAVVRSLSRCLEKIAAEMAVDIGEVPPAPPVEEEKAVTK